MCGLIAVSWTSSTREGDDMHWVLFLLFVSILILVKVFGLFLKIILLFKIIC